MDIDLILQEDDRMSVANAKSFITKAWSKISNNSWKGAEKILKSSFDELSKQAKKGGYEKDIIDILSKYSGKKVSSLSQFSKLTEDRVDEGFIGDWWKTASGNFYGAISFYPLLQAFLELDKIVKEQSFDLRYTLFYAVLWAFIISGKFLISRTTDKAKTKAKVDKELEDFKASNDLA